MRNVIARLGRRLTERVLDAAASHQGLREKTSPSTKIALKALYMSYRSAAQKGDKLPPIADAGFRIFSQFDEDGIILFLLGAIGIGPAKFVDIGGGDGIWASNCANLAFNLGFHGLFIDGDSDSVARGRAIYQKHHDTSFYPPRFQHAIATRSNVNHILRDAGFEGEIDLLSIDIDGNDYWIWEAIECVSPRIVLIETHVEFGLKSIVVPYDETYVWHRGRHPHYLGASPMAMTKLAKRLGYRLVGANRFGFNVFYLRNDLGQGVIPEIEVSDLLRHERNKERVKLFEEIKGLKYEVV
jgi:hypothetical protein